jgi:hypothetical protein
VAIDRLASQLREASQKITAETERLREQYEVPQVA